MDAASPTRRSPAAMRRREMTREVVATIASTEYRARYANSRLGFVWALVKPLMLFGVLYMVFARALKFGAGIPNFPLMLLLGVVLWSLFSEMTSSAVTVFVSRADLLRKVSLSPIILLLASSLTSIYVFVGNLVPVAIFSILSGVEPRLTWLLVPVLLVELLALAFGLALILSVLYTGLRDVGQIWEVLLQALFYATPVIWPLSLVDGQIRTILLLSPLAQIFQQAREAAFGTGAGQYSEVMHGWLLAVPYGIVVLVVVLGVTLYRRRWKLIVEQL